MPFIFFSWHFFVTFAEMNGAVVFHACVFTFPAIEKSILKQIEHCRL